MLILLLHILRSLPATTTTNTEVVEKKNKVDSSRDKTVGIPISFVTTVTGSGCVEAKKKNPPLLFPSVGARTRTSVYLANQNHGTNIQEEAYGTTA